MRNNKGISMITLIITIIVMIILAAIAFMAAGDQVGSAQFSKFASEFGDYATNFANAPVAEVTEALGMSGKATNKAQKIYAAARDIDLKNFDAILNGIIVPGGYTCTRFQTDIKDATGATVELASSTTPVYEIKSDVMKEYDGKKFYGDANGKETHWVTSKGTVFTLPGYPRTVDGEERMYITADLYYLSGSGDMITADDLVHVEPVKVGGDVVTGSQTAADAADSVTGGNGGETGEGNEGGNAGENNDENNGEENQTNNLSAIKVGDYVSYTPDTAARFELDTSVNIKWRVWEVNGSNVVIMPTRPIGRLKLGYENEYDDDMTKALECLADYNTASNQIETLCDNYTSSVLGITESDVRSLTIEDLEDAKISTFATQKLLYTNDNIKYNDTKTYASGYFGARYNEITGENDISSTIIEASATNPVTLKQTCYHSSSPEWKKISETSNETFGTLLDSAYGWLPSPCVRCYSEYASFNVYVVHSGNVSGHCMVTSYGNSYSSAYGVRPLVTLSSTNLTINADNPGDGSSSAPWNIVKK